MAETNYYRVKMRKTYSELMKLKTFEERFRYLALHGEVGSQTFGSNRFLNQDFYNSYDWRKARREVIIRDFGRDLGVPGMEIDHFIDRFGNVIDTGKKIYVHHINPLSVEDVVNASPLLFDPENLICVSQRTHEAIHYGDGSLLFSTEIERRPNDTCPWKRGTN